MTVRPARRTRRDLAVATLGALLIDAGAVWAIGERPLWPEDLGRVDAASARQAAAELDAAAREGKGVARAEALYRSALVSLEPLPGRDTAAARRRLVAAARMRDGGAWSASSGATLGWLEAIESNVDAARSAWHRVVIDDPGGPAAIRARVGLARLAVQAGRAGEAAWWLDEAVRSGGAREVAWWRDAAVRLVLAGSAPSGERPRAERTPMTMPEGANVLAGSPLTGAVLVGRRRSGETHLFESEARPSRAIALDGLAAATFDPYGRAFAAAGERVVRLVEDRAVDIGGAGRFASPRAIAVDPAGAVWLLDKRGRQLGRLAPGAAEAEPVRTFDAEPMVAIVWDGREVVACEDRTGRLVALPSRDEPRVRGATGLVEVDAIAVDPFGGIAVLDRRSRIVVVVRADGVPGTPVDLVAAGVERPAGVAVAPDGSLRVLDAATLSIVRIP